MPIASKSTAKRTEFLQWCCKIYIRIQEVTCSMHLRIGSMTRVFQSLKENKYQLGGSITVYEVSCRGLLMDNNRRERDHFSEQVGSRKGKEVSYAGFEAR